MQVRHRPAADPPWMKPYADRCPAGLQPTDKFRAEVRDPSTRCSCRPGMDPGSVQYCCRHEPPCFLLASRRSPRPAG